MWTKWNVSHEAVRGSHHRVHSHLTATIAPKTAQAQVENRTFNIKMMIIAAVANGFVCLVAGVAMEWICDVRYAVSTSMHGQSERQSVTGLSMSQATILFSICVIVQTSIRER